MIHWLLEASLSLTPSDIDVGLEPHEQTELILWLIVAAVSLIPLVIFSISYRRVRSPKLLITTLAFFLFFIKALILAMKLFIPNYVDEIWWSVAAVLDIVTISLIAYSLSRKS
jgi:predicted transcriptional regulator